MSFPWRRHAATGLCLVVLSAGCTSNTPAETTAQSPTNPRPPQTAAEATESPTESAQPFTLDGQIAWLIGVLDAGGFDAAEGTERFDPAFLAEVTVAGLNAPLPQIAPAGSAPWRVLDEHRDSRSAEITLESATGTRLKLSLALASAEPHQIEGLALRPVTPEPPEGYTTAQLDADMAALAQETAVGIYDVTDGRCEPIHEHNGDQPLAIGSIFKLWVLAELANQIHEGTATWNEPLEVRAELRSNPTGQIFQLDDGDTQPRASVLSSYPPRAHRPPRLKPRTTNPRRRSRWTTISPGSSARSTPANSTRPKQPSASTLLSSPK
jgi:hypothetical protein